MATRSLPTKPDRDATVEPSRGKGPTKGKRPPAAKSMRGKMVLKPSVKASAKQPARKAPAGKRGQQGLPDQQRARTRGRSAEQYVRLRVQVEDSPGQLIEPLARLGQGDATGPAVEERDPKLSFEGGDTLVGLNLTGTTGAEMWIRLDGEHDLQASDFLL